MLKPSITAKLKQRAAASLAYEALVEEVALLIVQSDHVFLKMFEARDLARAIIARVTKGKT